MSFAAVGRPIEQDFPRFTKGHRHTLPRGLEEARSRARLFGERHVRPRALEIDRQAGADPSWFDWDLVRAGADEGLLRILMPKSNGGAFLSVLEVTVLMEELCAACPGITLIFGAHSLGISPVLMGGMTHWDGVLADVVAAEKRGKPELMGLAATEPDLGTDIEDPRLLAKGRVGTHARRVPGGYRLNGVKRFISNGSVARWISTFMPLDPRSPVDTLTGFLVDTRSKGFSVGRVEHKMGQRACPAAELNYDDVFVPDEMLIGREGDGMSLMLMVLGSSRPVIAALSTGIARGAYERLLGWLNDSPEAKGLLERQQVQQALAVIEEEIHLARQAYMDAACELDGPALGRIRSNPAVHAMRVVPGSIRRSGMARSLLMSARVRETTAQIVRRASTDEAITRAISLSSLAKARGSDVAFLVTSKALEIVGLQGGRTRAELEKLWRDAKLTQIYEGTNQLNRHQVYSGLGRGEVLQCLPGPGLRNER